MSKLTRSARGRSCTLRLGRCESDETVVACHLPFGQRGLGFKAPDWWIAYGCRACHDIIDGRVKANLPREVILEQLMRAHVETMHHLIAEGLVTFR